MPEAFTERISGVASMDWVTDVQDAVARAWAEVPTVPDMDRMLFELAVVEIATNIAQHTDSARPPRTILELEVSTETLSAIITDDARPAEVDLDEAELPEDELSESGRGLALARNALDTLEHEPSGGNRWTLTRNISGH